MQEEVKHYKVKSLPTTLRPNSVYYVKATSQSAVKTYITDQGGVPYPLIDLANIINNGVNTVIGTGVTGTLQNPVVNISTFKSSEIGNLIELSSIDGKLFVKPITSPDGSIDIVTTSSALELQLGTSLQSQIQSALQPGDNISELNNDAGYITAASLPTQYIATEFIDSYIGNRLKPADPTSNGFFFRKNINGSIGYIAKNSNAGNAAVASNGVGIDPVDDYSNSTYIAHFGTGYYIPTFAGNGALFSTKTLLIGTYGTGDVDFVTGNTFLTTSSKFKIFNNGQLKIGTTPNTGTTSDDLLVRDSSGNIKILPYPTIPTIPTNTSDFINDGSDGTSTYVETDELGQVAFSNDYNDLDNLPTIPTTDNLVPYTGATQDVNLGPNSITADSFNLNTNSTESVDVGKIVWNQADGTFDMGLYNGVTLQAGQEMHIYAKASGAINNGDAVQFAGAQGDHLLIKKAVPSEINSNPEYFVGVATQDFANNDFGYVTVFGQVRELNTSMYPEGTVLYYQSSGSTDGLLTDTRPTGPLAKIIVAAVVRSHNNQGALMVRPHVMPMIGDVQNIEITDVQNGDILVYNSSTQVWENVSSSVIQTTGVTISFVKDSVYGTLDTPETGNITADVTGGQLGVTCLLIHNSGTAPTFSSEFKKLSGSGDYVTGQINYIFFNYITSTEIVYSVNQRT